MAPLSAGVRERELRVMIVTDQYAPMIGGVPSVTRDLAAGLSERGHAVAVVAPSGTRHGLTEAPGGAPELTVEWRGSLPWPPYPGQRLGLLPGRRADELLRRFKPDVVHVHSPLTLGAAARLAARRRMVPVVYTNHYLPLNVWPSAASAPPSAAQRGRDAAFYAYLTGFANRCDYVTAPTATALRLLREHGLRVPAEAVSNGVDLARFSPAPAGPPAPRDTALAARLDLPPGRPLVLSVGRLSQEKRADVLVAALARLTTGSRRPLLLLAGSGPDEARLRSLTRHYGVTGQVRFLGFVPDADLPALYRLADLFAIASQAELQSLATMAAMASGLPVVAADAGALGELVHPGENGFLVRPGRPAEFADCLGRLTADPGLRQRMARASERIIADHDRHRVLTRWESIYRALALPRTGELPGPDSAPAGTLAPAGPAAEDTVPAENTVPAEHAGQANEERVK